MGVWRSRSGFLIGGESRRAGTNFASCEFYGTIAISTCPNRKETPTKTDPRQKGSAKGQGAKGKNG